MVSQSDSVNADSALEPGLVIVQEAGKGPYAQLVRAGTHTWAADEPLSVSEATDTGPGPYDLLLAALGACTSMTMRMYADRRGYPLVRVGHSGYGNRTVAVP